MFRFMLENMLYLVIIAGSVRYLDIKEPKIGFLLFPLSVLILFALFVYRNIDNYEELIKESIGGIKHDK